MSLDLASPTAEKVKAQLQFYFSDSNYPRDKFLRGKAAENDGWIPLDVIATFSRMKQMTSDLPLIVAVAKSCEDLTVSEDGLKVKRKSPIPEKDTINERSVYVKGLPDESAGVSIESLADYFSSFGKVLSVRLRRDTDKSFKGKAYVEFATQTEADNAAKDKNQTWGTEKKPFEIFTKTQHFEVRKQKSKAVKDEKKRKREDGADPSDNKDAFTPGLVVELKGVPSTTERDNIKDILSAAGQVRYVDFHGKDQGIALVRFTTADGAKTAQADVSSKKMKIGDADIVARILEGDEEKKYWAEKVTPFTTAKGKGGKGGKGGNRSFKRHKKE
jgi:lupus La protein